jgi:predicted phage replisome organizer
MADVKWIKITTDIFDDEKILLIESLPDPYAIITCWFKLLCLAGKQNNSGVFMMGRIAYTDKMLATIFRMNEATVKMALNTFEQFGMVEIVDGVITIPNWNKHQSLDAYEKKKAYDRKYRMEQREKQRLLTAQVNDNRTASRTTVVVADKEEDKEEDKDIDKKNSASHQPSKADVDAFFESIWELYPVKKGKAQVSASKRKALFDIGFEKLEQAINRYLAELKKDASWRKPQNGSTFFNSGYVDYLDDNFVPDQITNSGRKEKLPGWFNKPFEMGDAETDAIRRMMGEPPEDHSQSEEAKQLRQELQALSGRN